MLYCIRISAWGIVETHRSTQTQLSRQKCFALVFDEDKPEMVLINCFAQHSEAGTLAGVYNKSAVLGQHVQEFISKVVFSTSKKLSRMRIKLRARCSYFCSICCQPYLTNMIKQNRVRGFADQATS